MERVATFAVRLDTLEETEITNKHVGTINLSIFVTYKAACLLVIGYRRIWVKLHALYSLGR
ncbi:TMhelix containing protein [Vibrio phage 1.047.O._10N.286.55.F2]|nr:TMhelix containing protein [Vibrio phage 1.047.O._10N.286.55.F2]